MGIEINPPKHVAIVGLGPSSSHYVRSAEVSGDRHVLADETWTMNSFGNVIAHDRLFLMDDVRLLLRDPNPKIVGILEMLKKHPGPVYTSRLHPDFPCLREYPLEQVINEAGSPYLNNTAAYAIAFAIAIGVERMSLYGIDFIHMDSHDAPAGRECCEYWIGRAHQRGITVAISHRSSLLGMQPGGGHGPFYGYETQHIETVIAPKVVNGVERPWLTVNSVDLPEAEWPPVPEMPT